jgi:hypothetical protein
MELHEDLYRTLHDDLEICRDYIHQIALGIIKGKVSKYPIFIAVQGEPDVDLGLPIINRNDLDISFNFSASHLEDFVNKGIITAAKTEAFIRAYKNPLEYMCIFVLDEDKGSFVFMPYERKTPGKENLN